eukprot:scaffold10807_cov79-Phaeocystis_antarctica.AAC.7
MDGTGPGLLHPRTGARHMALSPLRPPIVAPTLHPPTHPAHPRPPTPHPPPHHTHHTWTPPQQTAQGHGRGRPHDAREHGELHQAGGDALLPPLVVPVDRHVPTRSPTTQTRQARSSPDAPLGTFSAA